jgi:lipopolysaccharide transport system permease protein
MNRYVEFVWYRTISEIRADISRAFLGILWWIIEPVLYMAIFYLIFVFVLKQGENNYLSLLLVGLIVWKWFASTINSATTSITRNMILIYQVYLPKFLFPVIALFTSSLKFITVFLVFLAFLLFIGTPIADSWFTDLFFLLVLQALLMLGLGMILAAIDPFLPDIKFVVDNGLMMLFFLSGIFFRFDSVPESLRPLFNLNPVGVLIHNYREILIYGRHVDWAICWPLGVLAISFLAIGLALLIKFDRVYAKRAFL